jgi:hypothetical protein
MDYISNTQRVANIRTKLKEEFPDSKFSIRKSSYNGVNINILSAPIDLLQGKDKTNTQVNNYWIEKTYADNLEALAYLKRINEIAHIGVTYRETGDYGTQPSFYVYISIGDYDKPFLYTPSTNKKLPKKNTQMPKKNYNFDKGELLKECAGWDVYKKTLPDGRLVYNAYKKKETSSNKEDWNAIKGEIYTQSGFKWNRFGFERWGSMTTNDETLILDMLCEVLAKYYGGKEEHQTQDKSEFVYGSNWNVPNNYGAILIETLKSFGFEILEVKRSYFSIFKLNVDLTIDISDNGGEFNIENGVTKDFITAVNYILDVNPIKPFTLAKVIEEIYIDNTQQTQPKEDSKDTIIEKTQKLNKAIAGLTILANKGNEEARKGILGLEIILKNINK